jgi:uncharacterized protein (DUF433 family)
LPKVKGRRLNVGNVVNNVSLGILKYKTRLPYPSITEISVQQALPAA